MKKLIKISSLLIVLSLLSLQSCKKDYKKFDGTWNVTSWTEDGDEYIGGANEYTSVKIIFDADDKDSGNVTFKIEDTIGDSYSLSGTYTLEAKDDKITITIDGDAAKFDYKFDGSNVELDDSIDNIHIKATEE
jgi:hypothetical protein